MRSLASRLLIRLIMPAALLGLAACAPAPIYKTTPDIANVPPGQVARTPENYNNATVIWGGQVVQVNNLADHSEIEILDYPLDGSQRPRLSSAGSGRFIAVVQGYVEPLDYPVGTPVTLMGRIQGVRSGTVGKADYAFPLVAVDSIHKWSTDELRSGRSNVHFGIGVGIGIH